MKAVVAAFNQEKALVGAFSVITNLWMELFEALLPILNVGRGSMLDGELSWRNLNQWTLDMLPKLSQINWTY